MKTLGFINPKIWIFQLLWKGEIIPASGYPETVSLFQCTIASPCTQPAPPWTKIFPSYQCVFNSQNFSSMEKTFISGIEWHLVWLLGCTLGKSRCQLRHLPAPSGVPCPFLSWCSPRLVPFCFSVPTLFPAPSHLYIFTSRLSLPIVSPMKVLEITHLPMISLFQPGYTEHLLYVWNCARRWGSSK